MDNNRIADYFLISGIRDDLQPPLFHDGFVDENFLLKEEAHKVDPITDLAVIIPTLGEECPEGYKRIEKTVNGYPADLNHGSIRSPDMYLCYRRGRDRPPLTDIGVMYHGKERLMPGCQIVQYTPTNHNANVNNTAGKIYLTYMRAEDTASADTLVVTDICIILTNKGETPPHTYMQIPKSLNKALVGSDVYICYKKSERNAKTIVYEPQLLSRYPKEDDRECPLPVSVERFCLPLGATIEVWPVEAEEPHPKFSTFVLTGEAGSKSYGAAVSFYEEMNKSELDCHTLAQLGIETMSDRRTVHVSKSIGLISRWPFFEAFEQFLRYLYTISKKEDEQNLPIERCISHFFNNVPFPTNLTSRIVVQFPAQVISISKPMDMPLPQNGASYTTLLSNLGPENCLLLLALSLCEKYMIIHSLRTPVLTSTAEAVANMGFPLRWSCAYVPLLPVQLAKTLESPVPIVIGLDSKIFDTYEVNTEIFVLVDLDTCQIYNPYHKEINVKLLPKKPAKILKNTLERLFKDIQKLKDISSRQQKILSLDLDSLELKTKIQQKERRLEKEICEAFLRFMSCVLKGYSSFLKPMKECRGTKLSLLFDTDGFLKSKNENYRRLLKEIVKTQTFNIFIQERSFVSDQDTCLTFFDECIEKVDENKDEPPLFEAEVRNENTRFIGEPEGDDVKYKYGKFPILDQRLLPVENFIMKTPETKTLKLLGPMTLRTKQEVRSAQRNAEKISTSPDLWVKYLMSHCYSLWFIHLPSYVRSAHSKEKALRTAFNILVRLQNSKLIAIDEVCYRILMQLCGIYDQPTLAQSLLSEMRKHSVQPNAMTYGYYNKAVYDSQSASSDTRSAYRRWILLKNIVMAIAQFRINLLVKRNNLLIVHESDDCLSRNSLEYLMEDGAKIPTEAPAPHKMFDVHSTSSKSDDRTSIGGVSDRGYSSLSNEDGRKLSHVNGSQDSLNKLRKASQTTPVFRRLFTPSKGTDVLKRAAFTKRVSNIVRPSLAKSTSLPRGAGEKYGSQAGDLITPYALQESHNRIPRRRSSFGIEKCERPKQLLTDVGSEPLENKDIEKTKSSPSHTIATPTPVTINDPLGHFTTPPSTAASTPQKSVPKTGFVDLQPFQNWSDSYNDASETLTIKKSVVSEEDLSRKAINQTPKSRKPLVRAESLNKAFGSAKKYASSAWKKIGDFSLTPTKASTSSTGSLVSVPGKNSITEEERISWESVSQDRLSLDDGLDKKRNHLVSSVPQHLIPFDGETISINQQITGSNQSLSQIVQTKIEAQISSNFRCEHCQSLLYDEEITAGWTSNDCNFNTNCQFCSKEVVTRLVIYIKDSRKDGSRRELSVLYLNPLVLRRQLESIIENEGDLSLTDENFSIDHAEVFWNLLWYFRRLNVPSNLPGLLAKDVSSRQVVIRAIWDNLKIQDEVGMPMYVLHDQSNSPSPTVQALLTDQQPFSANIRNDLIHFIIGNDILSAIKLTLSERQKLFNVNQAASSRFRHRSVYRNLLFLACFSLGRQNIDLDAFDREYAAAYQQLTPAEKRQLRRFDQPPNMRTMWARKMFEPLELVAIQL
ncbi:DgyrCDS5698 [Dimorphilus gyrociliatus]|uniref:DgyrCDS5698 n=1 Tax=Dimorphilus gyrociliatus TaxID=2664684 RepID=A0A7I8VM91_9ANNE|nr:DgyrCDS5698 [Dimorphilus gyrociliatus]